MRITIRQGIFETNSSSMHAMVIASQSELDDFKNGKLFLKGSWDEGEFVSKEEYEAYGGSSKPYNAYIDSTPIWSYEEFMHLNDDGDGYDMCDDQEKYPAPGTIEEIPYLYTYKLHYQS